jgi:hypothetical protein
MDALLAFLMASSRIHIGSYDQGYKVEYQMEIQVRI